MSKVSLPDDIERWEKKSLREDIGSEKEHTHTIYVHKNFAIEHEREGDHHDVWNPYVLVNGHPFKLCNDWFRNFDEALGYIKGALKEKEILDEECDEQEEPEFPKAEACKSFVMPSAKEMFAEAHSLPDMYNLKESCNQHRQQMREFFKVQKAVDPSVVEDEDLAEKKQNEAPNIMNNNPGIAFQNMEKLSKEQDRPPKEIPKKRSNEPTEGVDLNDPRVPGSLNAKRTVLGTQNLPKEDLNPRRSENTLIRGYDKQGRTLIPANTSWDRRAFRNGMRDTIDYFNSIGQDLRGNAPSYPHLGDDLTAPDLPISGIQELYANNYIQNANAPNVEGQGPVKLNPIYREQLNLLGLPDFTSENLLTKDGDIDGRAWTLIQRGKPDLGPNDRATPLGISNGWYRTDDGRNNNFLRAKMIPYTEIGGKIDTLQRKPNELYDMLYNNVSYRDLVDLVRNGAVSGADLNRYLGFRTPEEMEASSKKPDDQEGKDDTFAPVVEEDETVMDRGSTDVLGDADPQNPSDSKKSFREEMEESIRKADADSGIPSGYVGTHPMKSPYKHVWLGYDRDANYPFTLRNAETGEVVCEVSDTPRDSTKN